MTKVKLKKFILIIFLFIFINIAFVNADCDWGTYGNTYSPLWNEQDSFCHGAFVNPQDNNLSIAFGNTIGRQPIIANFYTTSGNLSGVSAYLVVQNGNYLQVYDKNLALVQEILSGTPKGTPAIMDFLMSGANKSIVNLYTINSTLTALKVYSFDEVTLQFNLTFQQNFTDVPTSSGIRYFEGNKVYFTNSTAILIVNSTTTSFVPTELVGIGLSPPSYYVGFAGDGIPSYMIWSANKVEIFRNDGSNIFNVTYTSYPVTQIVSARMYKPTSSSIWKVAMLIESGVGTASPSLDLIVTSFDGLTYCSTSVLGGSSTNSAFDGDIAISDDYNGDSYPDIYVFGHLSYPLNSDSRRFMVLEGDTCDTLFTKTYSVSPMGVVSSALTIADMNGDLKNDFIASYGGRLEVINPYTDTTLLNVTSGIPLNYCVPADLNFDGKLDITCSESGRTIVFFSNFTNQLPVIVSVTYDTGTTIEVNTTLNMYVTATDTESDVVSCSVDCLGNGNWSVETGTTLSCFYNSLGIFNNTIRCRDVYHTNFAKFSTLITLTQTGQICNNNGNCDIGENSNNCPADCGSPQGNTTQSSEGGMIIPNEIVSTTNTNQGLLPEVYFGILGFFSNTLQPMIVIIFVIFMVLIMFLFARIIKKMADKVGR
jgi:hypothetical protein